MSFGNTTKMFGVVQEALILAMMLASFIAIFYVGDLTFKIGVAAITFSVIFLMTLAVQILRQQKEVAKASRKS